MPDMDASELDRLQSAIGNLTGPLLSKFKDRITYYVAVAIKGQIQPYPGPVKYTHQRKDGTYGVKWPSDAARKAYFAERRKRGLPMQYTRGSDPMSQRIQQSWTIRRGNAEATLGNRATYAPYVASSEYQTEQHAATGFTTDEQAAEQTIESGVMGRIVEAQIKAIVREAFRGL
jgi:hypothetical protein